MNPEKDRSANHSTDGKSENMPKEAEKSVDNSDETPTVDEVNVEENVQPEEPLSEIELLQQQLETSEFENKRSLAALQNANRNFEKQKLTTYTRATASVLRDMLPAIDNLDRAIDSLVSNIPAADEKLKGLQHVAKSFSDILKKLEAVSLAKVGDHLEPSVHIAVSVLEHEGPPNRILQILEQGWQIKGQLVRQALVVASKSIKSPASPQDSAQQDSAEQDSAQQNKEASSENNKADEVSD